MKKYFFIIAASLLLFSVVYADDIIQKGDPDVSKYPKIIFKINVFDPQLKNKEAFNLKEGNKNVEFVFKHIPVENVSGAKTILILLEDMSEETHPGQKAFFREVLLKTIDGFIKSGDKVNIALFDRSRTGEPVIRKLLANYTDDVKLLKEKIKTYESKNDLWYKQISSDLYAATYDGLTELKTTSFNQIKIMLILSAGKNNNESSESNADRAIKLAQQNRIPIYSIQYYMQGWEHNRLTSLIEFTYGKELVTLEKQLACDSLSDFMKRAPKRLYGQDYEFTFTTSTPKDNKIHLLELSVDNISKNIGYQSPEPTMNYKKYYLIAIIGGSVLLIFVFVLIIFIRKNKKKKQALENEREQEVNKQIKDIARANEVEQNKLQNELDAIKRQKEEELRDANEQKKFEDEKNRKEALKKEMKMMGRFARLCYRFDEADYLFEIKEPNVSIGRESSNDMPIPASTVSRNHCVLCYENNKYFLINKSETNPAKINGKTQDKTELHHGDVIELGKISIIFYC